MANAEQVERWAAEHPTCPRSGRLFEVPFLTKTLPKIAGVLAAAGVLLVLEWQTFQTPKTVTPEFLEEVKKIGPVAQRMNGPPVFLNPFTNRIPGGVVGPEDLKKN